MNTFKYNNQEEQVINENDVEKIIKKLELPTNINIDNNHFEKQNILQDIFNADENVRELLKEHISIQKDYPNKKDNEHKIMFLKTRLVLDYLKKKDYLTIQDYNKKLIDIMREVEQENEKLSNSSDMQKIGGNRKKRKTKKTKKSKKSKTKNKR